MNISLYQSKFALCVVFHIFADAAEYLEDIYTVIKQPTGKSTRYCSFVKMFSLRTFALIVYAHPYCARNSCRNATPRHASSARAEETFQPHIG